MTQLTDTWKQLEEKSASVLLKFMDDDKPSDKKVKQAVLASAVLRSITTHEANVNSHERTAVVLARSMYNDKEEMNEYLKVSAPRLASQQKVLNGG